MIVMISDNELVLKGSWQYNNVTIVVADEKKKIVTVADVVAKRRINDDDGKVLEERQYSCERSY